MKQAALGVQFFYPQRKAGNYFSIDRELSAFAKSSANMIPTLRTGTSLISTEGALRRTMTYDNHPSHPIHSHKALKTTSDELR